MTQRPGLPGVDHLGVGDHALQVTPEVGMLITVLSVNAFGFGAVKDGAEPTQRGSVEAGAGVVIFAVHDQAGDGLAGVDPLDASLFFVDPEAFVLSDVTQAGEQVADLVGGFVGGREGEVVGVAGEGPAEFVGDAGETQVQAAGDGVGQGGAGAGALRQSAGASRGVVGGAAVLDFTPGALGAEQGENRGDGGGVAQGLQETFDAGEGDGGEEVGEVGVDDDAGADVRRGVGEGAAAGDEAVGRWMDLEFLQDVGEDPLLRTLQAGVGEPTRFACRRTFWGR